MRRLDKSRSESPGADAVTRDPEATARSARGVGPSVALALAAQVVTASLTAVITLYLAHALTPHTYGEFALALGLVGVLQFPADLGISSSAGRFIAEHRHDRDTATSFLANALTLKLATSVAVAIGLLALAAPLADAYGNSALTWPFRGMALALLGQSIYMLFSGALVSDRRNGSNLILFTVESVAETLATVGLVALGGGATGAAFGRAAGYAVGVAAALFLGIRGFGPKILSLRAPSRERITLISRYAGVMVLVNGAWELFSQIDILLLGAMVGSTQVAFFSVPARLTVLLHYPGLAVANAVAPRLARTSGQRPDDSSYRVALRWLMILQAAVVAPMLVWAYPIVHLLFGRGYAPAAAVLRLLCPFIFLSALGPLVAVGVNYLGESRRRVPIAIGAFLVDLLIDVILIPKIGARASAIATSVAYSFYVPAHFAICCKLLEVPMRPFLVTLVRALLAAAAAGAVLAWVGTGTLTVMQWIGGAAGASLAFVATLLATRELTVDEAKRALGMIRIFKLSAYRAG